MDDLALLQRYVRFRDQDALAQLIEKYHGMVLATCRRRLYTQADAEDAAQEVFLAFTRDADKITSSVPGWLHICAVNTSVSIVRARRNQACRERHDRDLSDEPCPAGKAIRRETDAVLNDCLGQLDPAERELLIQNHVMDVPQESLALSMGITQQAVAKRIGKAMTRLRAKLIRRGVLTPVIALLALLRRSARAWASQGLARTVPSLAPNPVPTVGIVSKVKLATAAAAAVIAVGVTYQCATRLHDHADGSHAGPPTTLAVARAPAHPGAHTPAGRRFSNQARQTASPVVAPAPLAGGVSTSQAAPRADASDEPSSVQQASRSNRTPSGAEATDDLPGRDDPLADAAKTQLHPDVVASRSARRPASSEKQQDQAEPQADAPDDGATELIREVLDLEPKLAAVRAWKLWPLGATRRPPLEGVTERVPVEEAQGDILLEAPGGRPRNVAKLGTAVAAQLDEKPSDADSFFQISTELGELIAMHDQDSYPLWVAQESASDAADAAGFSSADAAAGGGATAAFSGCDALAACTDAWVQARGAMLFSSPSTSVLAGAKPYGLDGTAAWPVQSSGLSTGIGASTSGLSYRSPSTLVRRPIGTHAPHARDPQPSAAQDLAASADMDEECAGPPPPMPVEVPEPTSALLVAGSAAAILRPRRGGLPVGRTRTRTARGSGRR